MRVLMVTPLVDEKHPVLGFIPTWINRLAQRVDKLNVVTRGYNEETHLPQNVSVYSVDNKARKLNRMLYFDSTMLRLLLKETDVMFCHMYPSLAVRAAPYGKLFRIPVVWWRTHGSVSLKARIVYFLANKIVTASKESFRIKSRGKNKIIITGHGIDTDKFKSGVSPNIKKDKINIVSIGRISPRKDYETLIKAMDILVNERGRKDLEFLIVGGFPMASQEEYFEVLKKMVKELKLKDYVEFSGPVPHAEVVKYYQNCDLFVTGSQTGSIDKTVLEAMACEKPAIVCSEAFEDVFGDFSSTLMFRKKDPVDLAEKITNILAMDRARYNKLCFSMREIVKKEHSVDGLMDKLIKVFETCTR